MRIVITGSTGMVGSALGGTLEAAGHQIVGLSRDTFDALAGRIEAAALGGADAVVHLAGENIAAGRWTPERRRRIRDSRANGTRALARAIAAMTAKPRVLVSASAAGYYGDRGDEVLTEDSPPGRGFLSDVCREWEAATVPAAHAGVRVVRLRFGMILSARGGALGRMLPVFSRGFGGPLGTGRQYMSWITLADVIGVIRRAIDDAGLNGAINAVAPEPVRNAAFARALGSTLGRAAAFRTPAFMLRIAFGSGLADEVLLASQRVIPLRLTNAGFQFRHPQIEEALRSVVAPPPA